MEISCTNEAIERAILRQLDKMEAPEKHTRRTIIRIAVNETMLHFAKLRVIGDDTNI